MTEPVAYMYEDHVFKTEKEAVLFKKEFDRNKHDGMLKHVILPLFTADEISDIYKQNNRVEMTQVEFDEWKDLYSRFNEFTFNVQKLLDNILDSIDVGRRIYIELAKRVYQDDDYMEISKKQIELINLFFNYSPDNPEETIEIVPNKKWFVRSKEPEDEDEYYLFLSGSDLDDLDYLAFDYARAFDTKEEAELWTNPLTEAVQLPVEEE
ncbi:hypothetical protein [Leuconostoc mesenteroides]|uniref:hypothetical protein n=1 Tax=Leuconostoc mesenteroides TaxID=1245 RepID=UPI001CBD57E0|nr:hypothetical protein [Leuconostoc mesenteroides]